MDDGQTFTFQSADGKINNTISDTRDDEDVINQNPALLDWIARLRRAVREALPPEDGSK